MEAETFHNKPTASWIIKKAIAWLGSSLRASEPKKLTAKFSIRGQNPRVQKEAV
jgi:hypothetical protein